MTTITDDQTVTSNPTVTERVRSFQDRLARLGGAASGAIRNSEQEAVIQRALGNLPEFCKEMFRNPGFRSNGKGDTKGASHYWVVPEIARICQDRGLCFLEQKGRRALNLLTIWMAHTGIPLDDTFQCRDKVLIKRAIATLNKWCEEIENQKAASEFDPEADGDLFDADVRSNS
jgi:hypothetical protein